MEFRDYFSLTVSPLSSNNGAISQQQILNCSVTIRKLTTVNLNLLTVNFKLTVNKYSIGQHQFEIGQYQMVKQKRECAETHPPNDIICRNSTYFLSASGSMAFHAKAANAPPTNGPTMNTQSCANALPPSKRAGPMERAGLTDVPV